MPLINGDEKVVLYPTDVDPGRKINLIVRPLNMPERKRAFSISYGGLTLKGEVNTTLMDMVKRYPGHECTAIICSDLIGDGFQLNNTNYYITDPTYIGADAGMCMPQYRDVPPIVELWY